jgi:uncharacterized protein (DUF1499 family)
MGIEWKAKLPPAWLPRGLLVWLLVLALGSCGSTADEAGGGAMADEPELIDFDTLSPPDSPNNWLIAPLDFTTAHPDETAPIFDVPAERLARAWMRFVQQQPRTTVVAVSKDGLQIEAEQRSAVFGFIDRISARFVPLDPDRSTLIAYSRSEVGYWDLGVNRRRLQHWLLALTATMATAGEAAE